MIRLMQEHGGTDQIVVYDVPLLVESGRKGYGAVIVVDVDPEVAVARLVAQRGMDEADARARIANQASRADRLAVADVVIDNSGTPRGAGRSRRRGLERGSGSEPPKPRADGMVSTDEQARAAWPWLRAGLAAALCFHILGNATLAGVGGSLLGGVAAASVLAFPKARWPLAALAFAAAGLYWHEAPIVGNHLLLLAAIALAVAVESALRPEPARALAAARLGVLVFYGFAAFAKLNEGFFDPETSCAPFYLNESADSLGLPNLATTTGARWAAILLTVAIEASIPILLLVRRTRTFGVMLALGFHAVVALDRTHQFFDFSAVLSAVFVTFLPTAILVDAQQRLGRAVPARVVRVGAPAAALLAGLIGAVAADRADHRLALDAGWLAWQLLAVVVGVAIRGLPACPPGDRFRRRGPAAGSIPARDRARRRQRRAPVHGDQDGDRLEHVRQPSDRRRRLEPPRRPGLVPDHRRPGRPRHDRLDRRALPPAVRRCPSPAPGADAAGVPAAAPRGGRRRARDRG